MAQNWVGFAIYFKKVWLQLIAINRQIVKKKFCTTHVALMKGSCQLLKKFNTLIVIKPGGCCLSGGRLDSSIPGYPCILRRYRCIQLNSMKQFQ